MIENYGKSMPRSLVALLSESIRIRPLFKDGEARTGHPKVYIGSADLEGVYPRLRLFSQGFRRVLPDYP